MSSVCFNHPTRYLSAAFGLIFCSLVFFGCSSSEGDPLPTGSLAFKATWPTPAEHGTTPRATTTEGTPDVCTTFSIESISATVMDGSGTESGAGSWACDLEGHRGTIDALPVANDYRVVVEGVVADVVRWRGVADDIVIRANETTLVEKISMHYLDHLLTASSSDGGQIEPAGRIAVAAAGEQRFSFVADNGNEIADVLVDGVSIGVQESYTFSHLSADHTIYVSFVPEGTTPSTYTLSASAGAGGEMVPAGDIAVVEGNDQTFEIVAATGNSIVDVIVDGISQGAISSYTFSDVTADHTIQAAFDTTTYTISASVNTGGSIDPAGETTVAHGATPAFTISAQAGFYLASLAVNGSAVVPQSPFTFDAVMGDGSIEAVFKPVWYMAADAPAGGDGTTWQSAFNSLAQAIAAAGEGDEIWIKTGTYPLASQVSLNKAVEIYGGFAGTESYRHQRDWEGRPVIFDGQESTRCLYISADARLDGVTLKNGTLTGGGYTNLQGGALFIADCSPAIVNCTFIDNYINGSGTCSGGALYASNSGPHFENCRFEGNYLGCEQGGGGAVTLMESTTTFIQNSFINNQTTWGLGGSGGGIQIHGGAATIAASEFLGNGVKADQTSGGAISATDADLTITGSRFIQNGADAGRYSRGGAIYLSGSASPTGSLIRNTLFLRNTASPGYVPNGAYGGALFNASAGPHIQNCTFFDNHVTGYLTAQGGAIANVSGTPTITNTILWGNRALQDDETTVSDGEGFQLHDDTASSSTVTHSAIDQDGFSGNGNLREDPLLDAAGHLRPGSPCIDQGDDAQAPASDVDGEPRPENGRSDIGADEFIDGDDDDLPDYWEAQHGLDTGMDDSGEDLDGDGLNNLYEYRFDLNPNEANPVVDALHRGWYDDTGFHDQADNGTRCSIQGGTQYRSYFIFDLPPAGSAVVGAVLRLELVEYQGIRPSEAFSVHAVTTPTATLEASASGQTAIYNDLGDGLVYAAEHAVSPAHIGKVIDIPLSAAALSEINSALGGAFAVGIRSNAPTFDETDLFSFSQASEARTHQLVLIME